MVVPLHSTFFKKVINTFSLVETTKRHMLRSFKMQGQRVLPGDA